MENETKVKINKSLFFRLIKEAKPVWYLFAISLGVIIVLTFAKAYRPKLISEAISVFIEGFSSGSLSEVLAIEGIQKSAMVFLGLIFIELVFGYVKTYLLSLAGKKIIYNLRIKLFKHVQKLPLKFFDKTPVGVIVTRITNDPEALNEMFNSVVVGLVQNIIYLGFILYLMFISDVKLSIVSICLIPIIAVATILFRRRARVVFRAIRTKLSYINAYLSEHIMGMRIIQAFNMQEKKKEDFDKINKEFYKSNMDRVILFGVFRPMMDVVKYLTLAILLWFAGLRYMDNAIEIGVLYLFINYIGEFFHPIMDLADQFNVLQSSYAAGEKIYAILDQPAEPDNPDAPPMGDIKGEISFEHVWFAYIDDDWVLKDATFTIKPGESFAFVGHTGAGKSTIINLICGFYEHQKGKITIDGVDIKELRKSDYRHHIGLVLQDVYLTAGDVMNAIRLNDESISESRVLEIAKYLQADEFINRLEGGYKHPINQGGTVLSGGERQLISFARALIYDPQILIMDEASSSIDTETERLLQNSLEKLMKNRTTISVAHRLSTVQQADSIIVMHHGEIIEQGNHNDLLNKKGLYYQLYQLQYQEN